MACSSHKLIRAFDVALLIAARKYMGKSVRTSERKTPRGHARASAQAGERERVNKREREREREK